MSNTWEDTQRGASDPRIDPDFSHDEEHNREAATELGWTYDENDNVYRDSDGELVADEFGQPF